ncbi:MAG: translation initiation factor [Flavobacteriales bacterium]|nr:translation initiation factor [Flavobacteriales bacterium]
MKKNKNTSGGLIYSTNPGFRPEDEEEELETLPPEKQVLRVVIDRKNRGGKEVTLITGFQGTQDDLEKLAKLLKNKCGAGGSAKDGEIIIQGDKQKVILSILTELKYRIK